MRLSIRIIVSEQIPRFANSLMSLTGNHSPNLLDRGLRLCV